MNKRNCLTVTTVGLKKKMDVIQNLKSMTAGQFFRLQIFEFIYLVVLAFLPFVMTYQVVAYITLFFFAVVAITAGIRRFTSRAVDPANKVVLITGCDSGFGNACARQLVSRGFVVLAGCYSTDSEGARGLKEAASGNLHIIKLDITKEQDILQVILKANILSNNKGLWALVNNAGISGFGNVEFVPFETYQDVINVNICGTLKITKACLPLLRIAKGRVIMMTGATGKLSLPGQSAFCMSNFALEAFSDSLRLELQPFGVRVITIRPGNFAGATGMLNKSALEKIHLHFDAMKQTADKELIAFYGQDYLDNQYKQLSHLSKSAANSLISVTDAIENAVRSQNPKSQVLINGGNQLIDWGNVLISLRPFLPCLLHDLFVSRTYGTPGNSKFKV